MKRFLFALSILFCTTVFANNSFADCPSITPNYELEGIPVKIIADDPADGPVYIIAQPFEYNGTCFVWYSWMGRVFGLMSDYPSGTGTDYSNANISQPLEFCSETEAYQAFTDPTVYATLLYQSYEESVDFDPVGDNIYVAIFENSFLRQRCPITCDAGEVLYHDIPYKHCMTCRSEEECCLTEETTFTLSDYKDLESGNSLCYASGGNDPTGSSTTNYPDLMTSIGTSEAATGGGYLSNDGQGNYNTNTYGIANTGEFVVDYGNKGKIHGYASCSTRSATDPWVGDNGDYVLQNDSTIATLPNSSGQYCYCQLDGYIENGNQTTVDLSAPWVFAADENSGEDCGHTCAEECTTLLGYGQSAARSYRSAVFGSVARGSNTPAPARLRMTALTPTEADGTIIASGAYAKGAYNANVGNINNALTYVEASSVETIKHATVSAENVSLSVAGFTPAGTIDVDSSNATVSGTVNVANTVAMLSEWGTNSTENGTLSGSQQVSITNGAVTGMTGSFSGPASGQLSGTGTLSNASVHVNNWVPVNPQQ